LIRVDMEDRQHHKPEVTIRDMREQDLPAVCQLLCACYRLLGRLEKLSPQQVEFLLSKRGSLESVSREWRRQLYLVACAGDTILGVVAVRANEITKLYVDPLHHGKGVGRALFHAAEASIRKAGFAELYLGAATSAVPFYQAMGAGVAGHRSHQSGPLSSRRVTVMRKHLRSQEQT
jgi:ribosomal protein S18 acetylase RimI-like enzyme